MQNAKQLPKVYFGLHMAEGVAEYREDGQDPYRICINENTLKDMDATFRGRPVYVRHVEDVNLDTLQTDADGYVVRSFFNQADGKHWVEFLVVSDRGHEAVRNGWRLSNAYKPKGFAGGGQWHGVDYQKEITKGEYEHLAIVPNPRYEESKILTPEQFKLYNSDKELELLRIANSKGEKMSPLSFFKKTKVENAGDFENTTVILPQSKVEKTIAQLVNEADGQLMEKEKSPQMANGDHRVKVGEEEMSLNDLLAKHAHMCQAYNEMKAKYEPEAEKENGEGDDTPEEKAAKADAEKGPDKDAKYNKEGEGMDQLKPESKSVNPSDDVEKKKNEEKPEEKADKPEDKKKNRYMKNEKTSPHFDALKNAPMTVIKDPVRLNLNQMARGKAKYGSN